MTRIRSNFFKLAGRLTKSMTVLACLATLYTFPVTANAGSLTGTYILSPARLDTGFSVRVIGRGPVTGKFRNVSGKMTLNEKQPHRSRVVVTVDLSSVQTNNDKVTGFLKSSAMFNVAKYPKAVFQSTRVRITGKDTAEVEGVLTMRGQQKRTKLSVKMLGAKSNGHVDFEVNGGFFRSLYGMDAGLPIYADKVNLQIRGTGKRG
ncbi:YceI family protein [Roseibium aggregatum]|uniref:Polyisoprenoid-binding protein n=1 Tax=Roseibium aggregatum TaxID=187304 RepID=A0A939EDT3_9HYPH|nr:YceI family protein [Roseibium aggregatum]MBN9671118.1 polyisoprenoid-binding protein [Roseibium aggregatum]